MNIWTYKKLPVCPFCCVLTFIFYGSKKDYYLHCLKFKGPQENVAARESDVHIVKEAKMQRKKLREGV